MKKQQMTDNERKNWKSRNS